MALNKEKIVAQLNLSGPQDRAQLFCFEQLDSTNRWLLDQSKNTDIHGHVCVADSQTAGAGRGGKLWLATDAKNILLSLAYRFDMDLAKLSGLSLIAGIAIVDVLHELGVTDAAVKWPNDVYLGDAKLAGILIQTQKFSPMSSMTITGIGLNVELDAASRQMISQPVAQLSSYGFTAQDREFIVAKLINQLLLSYQQFESDGLGSFIDKWNEIDYLKHQRVTLYQANEVISGKYLGINDDGALLIELSDNTIKSYYFGELSVRREISR